MSYAYISNYEIKEKKVNIDIWNKDKLVTKLAILKKISTYSTLFNYHDFKGLTEIKYLYDLTANGAKRCIFCHKDSTQTTFKKFPHVIPNLLGNNYLLHHEECDECNKFFGDTLETELDKYLNPHRMLNRVKNRAGNLIKSELGKNRGFRFDQSKNLYTGELLEDELIFNDDSNHITINLKLPQYRPMLVYKALMKIFFGLLPREHLSKFENLRKWIINKDNEFALFSPMLITKTRLDGFSSSVLDAFILYKEASDIESFKINLSINEDFEYLAYLRFGHIVLEFPIFSDLLNNKLILLKQNNLPTKFNYPYILKQNFKPSGETIDFSESKKVRNSEPLYFSFDTVLKEKIK